MIGESAGMLAAGAAVVAAAELDSTLALQLMVSRPIVLGPLLGLGMGNALMGAFVGLIVELYSHDKIPIGGLIPANAAVSAGAGLLLALGPGAVGLPVAVPAGLFLGWLHERLVDSPLRRRRGRLAHSTAEALARGVDAPLGRMIAQELALQFVATWALLIAALVVLKPLGMRTWAVLSPTALGTGLWFAALAAPWFGMGMLAHSLRLNR
ncbi:MAG: PTS sugar transporter subunit IIC [Elusimicrobia bacterium]|nr:PTS sugar transporter subunit IIC [Elusimicrobiota bacterium]